jgi:DNA invertase Pin-like site-specific DNA recombinase
MDAYLYIRMSTKRQTAEDKDSERRQKATANRFISTHPELQLQVIDTIYDKGVSAFRGANFAGALGKFMSSVQAGKIKAPCYLLLEDLTRWSRDYPHKANAKLVELVEDLGVVLVTTSNGTIFSQEALKDNPFLLMAGMMENIRASTESRDKAEKVAAHIQNQRERIQNGEKGLRYTGNLPLWLTTDLDGKIKPIPERIKTINYIFDLYVNEGLSNTQICDRLNSEGVPTFKYIQTAKSKAMGKKMRDNQPDYWTAGRMISNILTNRALIGEVVFHKLVHDPETGKSKRVPVSDPIPDHFPPVVDKAKFLRCQELRKKLIIPRHDFTLKFGNLFTKLAVCGRCGASMVLYTKWKVSYLLCNNTRIKHTKHLCRYKSWRYDASTLAPSLEDQILDKIKGIDWSQIYPDVYAKAQSEANALDRKLLIVKHDLENNSTAVDNLLTMIESAGSDEYLLERYGKLKQEREALEASIKNLEREIQAARSVISGDFQNVTSATRECIDRFHDTMKTGSPEEVYQLRRKLNMLLRESINRIIFFPVFNDEFRVDEDDYIHEPTGQLDPDTGEPDYEVTDVHQHKDERHIAGSVIIDGKGFSTYFTIDRRYPVKGDRIEGVPTYSLAFPPPIPER